MSDVYQPECLDLRDFAALTEDQQETLYTRGVVLVDIFLTLARTRPAMMAAVLSCSMDEIARLRLAAEDLGRCATPPSAGQPSSCRTNLFRDRANCLSYGQKAMLDRDAIRCDR